MRGRVRAALAYDHVIKKYDLFLKILHFDTALRFFSFFSHFSHPKRMVLLCASSLFSRMVYLDEPKNSVKDYNIKSSSLKHNKRVIISMNDIKRGKLFNFITKI